MTNREIINQAQLAAAQTIRKAKAAKSQKEVELITAALDEMIITLANNLPAED